MKTWVVTGQLLLLLAICRGVTAAVCDGDWDEFEDSCYYVSATSLATQSWHTARKWCQDNGGDLASILTRDEQNFTTILMADAAYLGKIWIGLNQLSDRITFTWSDGSTVNFTDWDTHPHNDQLHLCTHTSTASEAWQTDNCGRKFGFMCKKPVGATGPATAAPTPDVPGYCPTGYYGSGNKCLKAFRAINGQEVNWTRALDICRSEPGRLADLASINNEEEQNIVLAQLRDYDAGMWIGMQRFIDSSTDWLWVDNSPVSYTAFLPGEPSSGSDELCVEFETWEVGTWNNVPCHKLRGYVCQTYKDENSVITTPQPTPFQCLPGYVAYWYACYKFVDTPVTWSEADQSCRNDGAHLVSIHSEPENSAVFVYSYGRLPKWLGFKKNIDTGVFAWTDGWYDYYKNWKSGEPSNGDCATITSLNGTWDAVLCEETRGYVCKTTTVAAPTTPVNEPGYCPTSWIGWGEHCYYFSSTYEYYYTWEQARSLCASKAGTTNYVGTVASIHSEAENKFIYDTFVARSQTSYDAWIGLKQTSVNGTFYWMDGSNYEFTNWAPQEPNYLPQLQCGQMHLKSWPGLWNGQPCDEYSAKYTVCKADKTATTTAPTAPTPGPGSCPTSEWQRYGHYCFLFRPDANVGWDTAWMTCEREGGASSVLATVNDFSENYFIHTTLRAMDASGSSYIGLYKKAVGYDYVWMDGTPVNYTNWNSGEPNVEDTEHCVEILHDSAEGKWNNVPCTKSIGFVCRAPSSYLSNLTTELPDEANTTAWPQEEGSSGQVAGIVIGVLVGVALLALLVFVSWRYRDDVQHHVGQVRQRLDQLPRPWNSDSKSNKSKYMDYDDQSLGGASVTSEQQPTQNGFANSKKNGQATNSQSVAYNNSGSNGLHSDYDNLSFDSTYAQPALKMNY